MAADVTSLKAAIVAAFVKMNTEILFVRQAIAITNLGNDIGAAIDTYVKTATATGVDVPTGDTHNLTIG